MDIQKFSMWKEQNITENIELLTYSKKLSDMTNHNQHSKAMLMAAELTEDTRLINVVKSLITLSDYTGDGLLVPNVVKKIYKDIHVLGRKKYGATDWNKYIYDNL